MSTADSVPVGARRPCAGSSREAVVTILSPALMSGGTLILG